jgi:hypothetical protein
LPAGGEIWVRRRRDLSALARIGCGVIGIGDPKMTR